MGSYMYVYIYIYIFMCVCIYVYIYNSESIQVYLSIYIYGMFGFEHLGYHCVAVPDSWRDSRILSSSTDEAQRGVPRSRALDL